MNIDIIKVPLFYGCDCTGTEQGPKVLMDNGLKDLLSQYGNTVSDKGLVKVPSVQPEDKLRDHTKMKYLEAIVQAAGDLAKLTAASLKGGHLPLVLGGDHAVALGSLAGSSRVIGNDIGVIWIDAHTDINTMNTTPSGNIHGMPLAASMGEGYDKLVNIFYNGQKVDPRNCFILGARSVDEGETELIDRLGINVWYMEEIREKGMGIIILELLDLLERRGIRDLHVSYDLDSLDASLVPGTGTPVSGGLWPDESVKLIQAIFNTGMVRSADFVEFNPTLDTDGRTLKMAMKMLDAFAQGFGQMSSLKKSEMTA